MIKTVVLYIVCIQRCHALLKNEQVNTALVPSPTYAAGLFDQRTGKKNNIRLYSYLEQA